MQRAIALRALVGASEVCGEAGGRVLQPIGAGPFNPVRVVTLNKSVNFGGV